MAEKLSQREKYLLLFLLVLMIGVLIYYGFINYQLPKYRELRQHVEIKQQDLQIGQAKIEKLREVENRNKELQTKLDLVRKPLETDVRNGISFYFIGRHAAANQVSITEVLPGSVENKKIYLELPLDIKARGKYTDIQSFIKLIEQDMPSTCELRSMEMGPIDKTVGMGNSTETSDGTVGKTNKADSGAQANTIIVTEKNPDIEVKIKMIAFMTESPKTIEIAHQWPLGRFDIFSPTVDTSVMFTAETQAGEEEKSLTNILAANNNSDNSNNSNNNNNNVINNNNDNNNNRQKNLFEKESSQPASAESTKISTTKPEPFPIEKKSTDSSVIYRFPEKR